MEDLLLQEINWGRLYGLLERITPLTADCGDMCRKKCCSPREEGLGIYLFPGEDKLFPGGEGWYRLSEYGSGAGYYTGPGGLLLNCTGKCPRSRRPLACRLFPLAPHMNGDGELEIILDRDAFFICPLVADGNIEIMEPSFRETVHRVWEELVKDFAVREAVLAYSARTDRQSADPWLRLFSK
jgi:hypothetical protein